jgi:hypothetical protein
MHQIWLEQKKGLFMAPLKGDRPLKIIDVGCGSGTWANALGMDASNCNHHYADRHLAKKDGFQVSNTRLVHVIDSHIYRSRASMHPKLFPKTLQLICITVIAMFRYLRMHPTI